MAREPTAAQALFPHLRQGTPDPVEQQRPASSLAQSMFSSLAPKPKPPPNYSRESLLRNLRELNAKIDARLQREGKRR
jgi:hypothetical protein